MITVDIPFDPKWKNVAVAVSGGADSALLSYLICSKISSDTTVHIINNIRCWKTKPWQQFYFHRVFEWLQKRFPNIGFKLHTNFVAPELEWGTIGPSIKDEYGKIVSGDVLELRAFSEYVCVTNKVEAYFNGTSRNPRDANFKGPENRDIEPNENNKSLEQTVHMGVLSCHPFRFIEKSWIVKQYIEHNIMDLFELTRSCEGIFKEIDYQTYTYGQYVPICKTCFWCKEREWALEQNQ